MTLPITAGLWFDYDPDLSGLAHGASVPVVTDQSGNGNNGVVVVTPVTCVNPGLNGFRTFSLAGGTIRGPAITAAQLSQFTMFAVFRWLGGGSEPLWCGDGNFYVNNATVGPPRSCQIYSVPLVQSANQVAGGWTILHWHGGGSAAPYPPLSVPYTRGGFDQYQESACGGQGQALTVGNFPDMPRICTCEVARWFMYTGWLTYTQEIQTHNYLASRYALWRPTRIINTEGNSTTQNNNFATHLARQLDDIGTFGIYNTAIAGTGRTEMAARAPQVNEAAAVGPGNIYQVLHTGHNDGFDTGTMLSTITSPTGPNQSFRTNGGRILFCTASQWAGLAGNETARVNPTTGLNPWIRANWASVSDAWYDLGATPQFGIYDSDSGAPPAGTSRGDYPTYWVDQVHHTDAGQSAKAALLDPTIRALVAPTTLVANTGGTVTVGHGHVPSGWTAQLYRSSVPFNPLTPSTRGTAVSGATTVPYADSPGTPGATRYYSWLLTGTTPVPAAVWSPSLAVVVSGGGTAAFARTSTPVLGCGVL